MMKPHYSIATIIIAMVFSASTLAQPALQWQKCLGGSWDEWVEYSEQTDDGGYIIVGSSESTDGNISGNHGAFDCWIVKLDSVGALKWQKAIGGTGSEYGTCIRQTADGGYIVAASTTSNDGDVSGNHGTCDYWVIRLNENGDIQWQKTYGGTAYDFASFIDLTNDGGYIISGYSNSDDGDVTGNHGNNDYWIINISVP